MLTTIARNVRYHLLRHKKDWESGNAEVHVWFRCPNCHKTHNVRELTDRFNFEIVYYDRQWSPHCTCSVRVRMPWVQAKDIPELQKLFKSSVLVANPAPSCSQHTYGPPAKILVVKQQGAK